ncbi:MAG: redoxin domain-containing protein [Acidobacteriota bacterium]
MSEPRSKAGRFWSRPWTIAAPAGVVLVILVLALVASNTALLSQNRALKQTLKVRSEPAFLTLGQPVSTLRGLDLRGEEQNLEIATRSKKTVLLVFQPTCQWCRKNMDNWSTLLEQADRESYRFLAISTRPEGVADYVDQYPAMSGMPMIADPHLDDRLRYRLYDTPQTIVIDSNGVVEKIWLGALGGRVQQDVEAYFALALPGVSDLS